VILSGARRLDEIKYFKFITQDESREIGVRKHSMLFLNDRSVNMLPVNFKFVNVNNSNDDG